VRAGIDARDLRGGEKSWQHIKQGVPLRVEIGPRDLAEHAVSFFRRDRGVKDRESMALDAFIEAVPDQLEAIQEGLLARAGSFRDSHTRRLESLAEVEAFFTPPANGRGMHGGFALVHVADDPAVTAALDPLKVTVRCVPIEGDDEPGKCVVTGRPTSRRSVLAKAY